MSDNKSVGSIIVDVEMDTTSIQKKMKVIGEGALQIAQALQGIEQEANTISLSNYSTTELINELGKRAQRVSGSTSSLKKEIVDHLKLPGLEIIIKQKY